MDTGIINPGDETKFLLLLMKSGDCLKGATRENIRKHFFYYFRFKKNLAINP